MRRTFLFITLMTLLLFGGCASTPPPQAESTDYRTRVESQTDGGIRVSAVVLSPQETINDFSIPLGKSGIQPVWLEIENQEDKEFYLILLGIDPEYFSPSEVAWLVRNYGKNNQDNENGPLTDISLDEMFDLFLDKHIPVVIPPHNTVSGYVYTNIDPGAKAFAIDIIGDRDHRSFEFVQLIPGFQADFLRVNFDQIYAPEEIKDLDLKGLRAYLEDLPCCALGGDRKTAGDPLNLVIVGEGKHLLATLVRQGWDLTETKHSGSSWRTVKSSLFGAEYRTSPVSPLYLYNRPQDIALQKARGTVDERNHLRLWRAPVTLNGQNVYVGQISRDIGVKFSSKTFVTHKIDPVIDEARLYITQDLVTSQTLRSIGYVQGVGFSNRERPRFNYTKDPYYTDGLRVVIILGKEQAPLDTIEYLPWVQPKGRK